jgi:hypothetical protein
MRIFLLAVLLSLAGTAQAGHRLTYLSDDAPMVIDLADNGDARMDLGELGYGLMLGGKLYWVVKAGKTWAVVTLTDFMAAAEEAGIRDLGLLLGEDSDPVTFLPDGLRIEPAGTQTVAGQIGKAYRVYGLPDLDPGEAAIFVMSDAPLFAPVSRLFKQLMLVVPWITSAGVDTAYRQQMAAMRAILALGVPLDSGGNARLQKIETVNVSPATLRLPAKPLTRAQIVTELKALRGGGNAPGR